MAEAKELYMTVLYAVQRLIHDWTDKLYTRLSNFYILSSATLIYKIILLLILIIYFNFLPSVEKIPRAKN